MSRKRLGTRWNTYIDRKIIKQFTDFVYSWEHKGNFENEWYIWVSSIKYEISPITALYNSMLIQVIIYWPSNRPTAVITQRSLSRIDCQMNVAFARCFSMVRVLMSRWYPSALCFTQSCQIHINLLRANVFQREHKHIFTFCVIPPHWYDTGT